ncbi:MAG: GspE/PulE family protein [Verrucomicrobiales bacterium]
MATVTLAPSPSPQVRPLPPTLARTLSRLGLRDLPSIQPTIDAAARQHSSPLNAILALPEIDEALVLQIFCEEAGLEWIDPLLLETETAVLQKFPPRLALRHVVLPLNLEGDSATIVMADPYDWRAQQAVSRHLNKPVTWRMSSKQRILELLRDGYGLGAETFEELLEGGLHPATTDELAQEITVLDADDPEASVMKFVNQVIRQALEDRATDIHVEPLESGLRIRFRVDGVLREIAVPPEIRLLQASVVARLKIMAHLDINERRLPQDGRINLELAGRSIDVRVACIPSVVGESVSLRLLGQEQFTFARLSLEDDDAKKIKALLDLPNGIVLLTGPTGCGKSTTLYTFLSMLNTQERRIVTVEEPVEHKLPGVVQIAVRPEIGLTFARGLRSILRGDPNVVMVGEMRDVETAEIAIRAALTGHLVFSTLHTNDAVGGITRLVDMGIEPFLVGSAVRAFLAQRLVRTICPHCRQPADSPSDLLAATGFPMQWNHLVQRGRGCPQCRQTGYQGRVALFEVCLVDSHMQELIAQRQPASVLRDHAERIGMTFLRENGWRKVAAGVTTLEEVLRVTTADN